MDILAALQGANPVMTPQTGVSQGTAAAMVAPMIQQVTNGINKDQVVVAGPMVAGKTPDSVLVTGTTYSQRGAPVEESLVLYFDGTASTQIGTTVRKLIFDAFGNNACKASCNQSIQSSSFKVSGKSAGGNCDQYELFLNKLKAGQVFDIATMRVEDVTGDGKKDTDYEIVAMSHNFNGAGSTAPYDLGELSPENQYREGLFTVSAPPVMSRIDGDTAWEVPIKAGRKLKIILKIVKRYQLV